MLTAPQKSSRRLLFVLITLAVTSTLYAARHATWSVSSQAASLLAAPNRSNASHSSDQASWWPFMDVDEGDNNEPEDTGSGIDSLPSDDFELDSSLDPMLYRVFAPPPYIPHEELTTWAEVDWLSDECLEKCKHCCGPHLPL